MVVGAEPYMGRNPTRGNASRARDGASPTVLKEKKPISLVKLSFLKKDLW